MVINDIPTEQVYQISNEEQRRILQKHFQSFYQIFAELKPVPHSSYEIGEGWQRCLSGIPYCFLNAVLETPEEANWDDCIQAQLQFFQEANVPFVWYVNENSQSDLREKLIARGFQDVGVFRGVIGLLNEIPYPEIDDCTLEQVLDETSMDEYNEVVCSVFGIQGVSKELYRKAFWQAAKNNQMTHWVARKDGRVVSAVSTLIIDDVVSFWNGATLSEFRREGISTALRLLALHDAIAKGCHFGVSYLMSEGLAFGICTKLGYETKWRFNAFVSPGGLKSE